MEHPQIIPSRRRFLHTFSASTLGLLLGLRQCKGASEPTKPEWIRKADMPIQTQEIYCAVLNGRIHTAGGFMVQEDGLTIGDRHIAYDPVSDQWTDRAPLPSARHHLQLTNCGGKLYGTGGFQATGPESVWVMQAQTWAYDPETDMWTERSPAPRLHGETVSGSLGDRIHIVGGRHPQGNSNATWQGHVDTDHHLVYDPAADRWDTAAPASTARNSAAAAVIDGQLYVAGGRTVNGGNVASLEIYDPQKDKWRSGTPMPQAQGGLAAAAVKGKLYAFGGEYFDQGGGVHGQCWQYDPATDRWTAMPGMLTPRHGLGGAAIGNSIYAIGGAKRVSADGTSGIMEALKP